MIIERFTRTLLIINQYSYILISLFALMFTIIVSWRLIGTKYTIPTILVGLSILILIQLAFKTNDPVNSSMTSLEDLLVDQGPVIVVVYSDF